MIKDHIKISRKIDKKMISPQGNQHSTLFKRSENEAFKAPLQYVPFTVFNIFEKAFIKMNAFLKYKFS